MLTRTVGVFSSILLLFLIQVNGSQRQAAEDTEDTQDDFTKLNGEKIGGNFQGDMILSKPQIRNLNFSPRNGLISKRYRWPKNEEGKVIVPYSFKDPEEYTSEQKGKIRTALNEIEEATCIRFVEDESDPRHIQIFSGQGCFSDVGMQPSKQNSLSLKKGSCEKKGTIIHDFLHALGFFHMQSAHDRQKFIRILYNNVEKDFLSNFNQYSNHLISHFGTKYDIDSIMHYPRKAFSKNGKDTIQTINPLLNDRIGQRVKLSPGDIKRVNNMYKCE